MEILRLRFVAIILMARSPNIIATPVLSPSAVGVTLLQVGTAVVIRVVGSGDRIEHPADGVRHRNRLVLGVNL